MVSTGSISERHSARVTARLAALGLALVIGSAGCTGAAPARQSISVPSRLVASITQFRPDEGTRGLHAGVTNQGPGAVTVTRARVVWPGFAWTSGRLPGGPVPAGQTAAFVVRFGAARCPVAGAPPYLVVEVDGRVRRLPLHVDIPGLLQRLHVHACAMRRLADTARVRLLFAQRPRGADLPAVLVLRRRPGTTAPVRVVDLGGSVLLDLQPAPGVGLPATLGSADQLLRLPVRVRPTGRCDGHALGNSSQTFLLSAWTRLGRGPVERSTFLVAGVDRRRLQSVLDRACAHL